MRPGRMMIAFGMLAGLSGCMASAPSLPQRQDTALRASAKFSNVKVALLYSENTLAMLNQTTKMGEKPGWQEIGLLPLEFRKRFSRHFDSVKSVHRIEDADEVDLIAMWDAFATLDKKQVKIENNIVFYDRDNKKIDDVRGESLHKLQTFHVRENAAKAVEESLDKLDTALRSSAKLAEVAKDVGRNDGSASPRAGAAPIRALPPAIKSDIDRPGYKLQEKSDLFGVVIGVGQYAHAPEAEFAERDAEAVRNHLLALGYPSRNIVYLTGEQAGNSSIQKYVEAWLPRNLSQNSKLFFYFSGHGAPDTSTGQAYLMPWDGDPNFLEQTAYPVRRLYAKLNALPAKEVVVALDACFSGAGGRSVIPKGTRPLVSKVTQDSVTSEKLIVLAAADGSEITGTESNQGHGLFTYYLLKGLNGAAGQKVTVKGLFDYVLPHVRDAARRENRDQTPQLIMGNDALGERVLKD